MVGSIDPRCETLRGTHWPVKVAGVFGTRVAENHLGQRSATASTGRTYGCKRSDQTLKNSCGTGAVHIWVPAFAGTTLSGLMRKLKTDSHQVPERPPALGPARPSESGGLFRRSRYR